MFTIWTFAIILNKENQVLIYHRNDYDLWNLPWWKVETSESPWKAVIREVKEETWLDVKVKQLYGVYSKPETDEIVFQFVCEVTGGELTLNDEARAIEYFDKDNLPAKMAPKQIERINDYFSDTLRPVIKEQFGKWAIQLIKEGKF